LLTKSCFISEFFFLCHSFNQMKRKRIGFCIHIKSFFVSGLVALRKKSCGY